MEENNNYTAADFERYHSGKMTNTEMHGLEKAALRDPFLADALEGYRHTSTPVQDIKELREKLSSKKKKNVFLLITGNKLLRIAAVFILIAGAGYLTYRLNFNTPGTTTAQKEIVDSQKTSEQAAAKDPAFPIEAEKDIVKSDDQTTILRSPEIRSDKSQPLSQGTRDVATRSQKNIVTGKVVDTRGNPISRAIIKDEDEKTVTTSDSLGRFKMASNDSLVTATIAVPGYSTKQKSLSDKTDQVIVMQEDKRELNEVALNSAPYMQERKANTVSKKAPATAPVENISEPEGGLIKFYEYVRRDISIPTDGSGKSYTGKVILSFDIRRNGNVKNIKVDQSLCSSCDEEAKRLLRQGPKWKYINDKRQSVTIEF